MEDVNKKMDQVMENLREEMRNLRTGRPNPRVLDPLVAEIYGTKMRIRDLATVTVDGRQLIITTFDPQTAPAISKAIEKANLGLMPHLDGNIIRLPIPPMTEEIRKKIAKEAKEKTEKAKIAIRNCRREANDQIKKSKNLGEITEDDQKKKEKQIQELTDRFCKEADQLFVEKEKEILAV